MELIGKIFLCGMAVYVGNHYLQLYPQHAYGIGISVGAAAAISLSY